jgi:hemoglobin
MRSRFVVSRLKPRLQVFFACGLFVAAAACGPKKPAEPPALVEPEETQAPEMAAPEPPAPKTLWQKLGGKEGMSGVVDAFLANVFDDNRFGKLFDKTKKDAAKKTRLRDAFVAYFCVVASGAGGAAHADESDCAYAGKSMKDAHNGMKISPAQWDAFKEDLHAAMLEKQIDADVQKQLDAELDKLRADIVVEKKK